MLAEELHFNGSLDSVIPCGRACANSRNEMIWLLVPSAAQRIDWLNQANQHEGSRELNDETA